MKIDRRRLLGAAAAVLLLLFAAGAGAGSPAPAGDAAPGAAEPVFVYDYGWFEAHGYECWNLEPMWRDVPARLKSRSWLILYMAPEQVYSSAGPNTGSRADIEPRPDPEYAKKDAALEKALQSADREGIGVILMVRRWCKSRAAAPPYARVEKVCREHACVKGLLYTELGSHQFGEVCQEHARRFTAIARAHGRKVFWAAFMSRDLGLWNQLMSDAPWRRFLEENRGTIVPTWKNVEPSDNMLNWAGCLGLWLSGLSAEWGFMFDSCYWPQYIGAVRRGQPGRRTYWDEICPKKADWFTAGTCGCPPYLVKDTLLLAALTGCRYFQFERFQPFEPGGPLRPVRDKIATFILDRALCRTEADVRRRARVAVETPSRHEDLFSAGFSHTYTNQGPNLLWKTVFGIGDYGFDVVPNEGRHYAVPVVPPGTPSTDAMCVVPAGDVARPGRLAGILAKRFPRRFTASDPHVLVFDAGELVYLTDAREDGRTTLDFVLESTEPLACRCTFLAQDGTPTEIAPATEASPRGWRKRFVLFPGSSILLDARKR